MFSLWLKILFYKGPTLNICPARRSSFEKRHFRSLKGFCVCDCNRVFIEYEVNWLSTKQIFFYPFFLHSFWNILYLETCFKSEFKDNISLTIPSNTKCNRKYKYWFRFIPAFSLPIRGLNCSWMFFLQYPYHDDEWYFGQNWNKPSPCI